MAQLEKGGLATGSDRCLPRAGGGRHCRAVDGGSGQIVQHRLVGLVETRGQDHPAESREEADLGFVADDDGALAVGPVGGATNFSF